jgi:MFS family permease
MYVGVVFGNLIFGALGDIYGRQRVVAVAWLLGSFGVLGIGLSESFGVLVFFTIFTGLTLWPPLNLAMIMVNEQCDTRFR